MRDWLGKLWYTFYMAITNETNTKGELILTVTNGHKETIEKLVKAYRIKGSDEAKLIAFLIDAVSQEGVIGNPIGGNGRYFTPTDSWVEKE